MIKGWKIFWIVFDVLFFVAYFLYGIALADPGGMIRYYDGLNDTDYSFRLFFVPIVYSYILLAYIAILVVRLIFWQYYFTDKRSLRIARMVTIVLMLICNPVTAVMIPLGLPGYKPFTEGFYQRMQDRLDVQAIRTWMEGLEANVFHGDYYDVLFPMEERTLPFPVPQEISMLGEELHYLRLYMENSERRLRIEWGGPLVGRWGVVIGPKDMAIPPTEDVSYDEHGLRFIGEYRLRLEEGVYVWHEIE